MGEVLLFDPAWEPALRAAGLRSAGDLLALGDPRECRRHVGFVRLEAEGRSFALHLKRYRYDGWRASRGLLGRGTLWGVPPEIREFHALRTLRASGVPAVRPVAACATWVRGRLGAQALLTEAVQDAPDLAARLHDPADALRGDRRLRRALARALGDALRRMHDLGFVHRDCHARNVLVRVEGDGVRLWFLDCRRGGVRGRGGPLDDLASLDRDLRGLLTRGERRTALAAWLRGEDAGDVVRRIARRRERLPAPRVP
jgi:hypothetical protein